MLLGLIATTAWADECQELMADLEQSKVQHNFRAAMDAVGQIEFNFCENSPIKVNELKKPVLRAWGDDLFDKIFQQQKVVFNKEQTARLLANKTDILAANDAATVSIQDAWQIAFLKFILDEEEGGIQLMTPEAYQLMDKILSGYIADFHTDTLSVTAKSAEVDEFVKQLMEAGLLKIDARKLVNVSRGSGESALTELVRIRSTGITRGSRFSSSAQQPATAVTPIRFEYDSTTLTEQGRKEYQENLGNLLANTTDKILLIGHTDKKGSAEYNCWLSQCRVRALKKQLIGDGVSADKISIAWAGENIPLSFSQADAFLNQRDIVVEEGSEADPLLRRVEYELNGDTLKEKYRGKLCVLTNDLAQKPCDFE